MAEPKRLVSALLPQSQRVALYEEKARTGKPLSELLRQAVEVVLSQEREPRLRDQFAIAALMWTLNQPGAQDNYHLAAKSAYDIADAMVQARKA